MKPNYHIYLLLTVVILCVSYLYILNMVCYSAHDSQTKEWMSDVTDVIILGLKDRTLYSKLNRDGENISFWYVYWFIHTDKETTWVLANLRNKFSPEILFNIYNYNIETKHIAHEGVTISFKDIQVSKKDNTLNLKLKDIYEQTINLIDGKSTLNVNTSSFKIFLNLSITDCNTNLVNFIPFVNNVLGLVTDVKGSQTKTPGEWFSDNPYIGKVLNGSINGNEVYNGSYWFDNFIACNNGFLTTYIWFVVLNGDWLIYLLWFGDQKDHNSPGAYKPILIKNIKEDRMLYSGMIGVVPELVSTVEMSYETSKKLGDDEFDSHTVKFLSPEVNIIIKSKPNTCKKVFEFLYYKSTDPVTNFKTEWDKEYYDMLNNIVYVEYLLYVDVSITYKGKTEEFTERQIIDAMYRADENKPRTLEYR